MSSLEQTIQNLLQRIPGYTGYAALEQRRDADKTLRMYLAQQYRAERQSLTRLGQQAVAAGRLDVVEQLQRIGQLLDLFIGRLETAPRGYAGWFSEVSIDEADLDRIYQFDAKLADSVPLLRERIGYVAAQVTAGEGAGEGVAEALSALRDFVDGLNRQFDAREELLVSGKRPA